VKQKPGGGGGDGRGDGAANFQDVGSQFWDLDFTHWASHDPGSTRLHSVRRTRAPTSTFLINITGFWTALSNVSLGHWVQTRGVITHNFLLSLL
jgi:hypothetical protein